MATINAVSAPEWLDVDWLLGQFGKQRKQAIRAYARFVMEGKSLQISKAHRRILVLSLDKYKQNHPSRNEAMARAYLSGAYSMAEIGGYFGVHCITVSRAVRKFEGDS